MKAVKATAVRQQIIEVFNLELEPYERQSIIEELKLLSKKDGLSVHYPYLLDLLRYLENV